MKEVYIVIISSCDGTSIKSVHKTYDTAFNKWNEYRKELLQNEIKLNEWRATRNYKIYNYSIKNLECEDPEQIDNFPHDTPQILKYKLED